MAYETIIVEVENHIALIKLNRPDALNALNAELLMELVDALESAQKSEMVRCIVITGSEKAFAAGADIKMMSSKSFSDVFNENLFGEESDRIGRIRKPIIAAVSGYALGGGCELAMMCDIIIAGDNAQFGQPEIKLGTIPGCGGTQVWWWSKHSKHLESTLNGFFFFFFFFGEGGKLQCYRTVKFCHVDVPTQTSAGSCKHAQVFVET